MTDCHQHLWPAAFVELLRRRHRGPRLEGWTLLLDGEPPYVVDPAAHDLVARRATDAADGIDLALLSLSSPLGIESMHPDESAPLLAAWHSLADDLERDRVEGFGLWASVNVIDPDLADLATWLRHPRVHGLQVPAPALADPASVERLAPMLALVEAADLPVLVHPGPVLVHPGRSVEAQDVPGWWPALTSYTAQLSASWFAWHVAGRRLLPRLRIAFVGLAGLAPLHHERLAQRGGELGAIDPLVHYETSSYGTRAIDAMVRVVGVDPLVHGSDRPYARPTDPGLGAAFSQSLFVTNPAHLLNGAPR
ncbi:amidohydrolase family protein [Nocardioides sp. MAH-18]|uniref:Amidohydrolase family protein n=1 Tax=Nocardioides agri TaxID=2682843 RepID=A0A6L6XR39_9ACTN|nr:amidohydrolase family protein [Nocardioides sp. CGMCC 1.13656]MVQ49610.1 amidohydrolase family protein [Nocardioides sp. MAH-18]